MHAAELMLSHPLMASFSYTVPLASPHRSCMALCQFSCASPSTRSSRCVINVSSSELEWVQAARMGMMHGVVHAQLHDRLESRWYPGNWREKAGLSALLSRVLRVPPKHVTILFLYCWVAVISRLLFNSSNNTVISKDRRRGINL